MKRVSRPDTLHTELAELRRRLRLLETSSARRTPGQPLATPARAPGRPALLPARPEDWWATDSATWERLAVGRLDPGPYELAVTVLAAADDEVRGQVRVTVDGGVVSEEVLVAGEQIHHVLAVAVPPDGGELAVEARRVEGDGRVRVYASL
jgi:alkylhydroperoxidase/carboxymuconolactone decarboxylase family protein YurZ